MGDTKENRRSCCLLILYELALVVLAFLATANYLNRAHTYTMWEILTASGLATAAAVYVGSAALSVLLLPDVFFNPQLVRLPLWLEDEPHTVMANQLVLGSLATCLWSFGLGGIISAFQSRGVLSALFLALATATITYLYAGALRWAEKEDGNLGCIGTLVFHFLFHRFIILALLVLEVILAWQCGGLTRATPWVLGLLGFILSGLVWRVVATKNRPV